MLVQYLSISKYVGRTESWIKIYLRSFGMTNSFKNKSSYRPAMIEPWYRPSLVSALSVPRNISWAIPSYDWALVSPKPSFRTLCPPQYFVGHS